MALIQWSTSEFHDRGIRKKIRQFVQVHMFELGKTLARRPSAHPSLNVRTLCSHRMPMRGAVQGQVLNAPPRHVCAQLSRGAACSVLGLGAAGGVAAHACTEMKLGGIEVVATALVVQVRCVGEGEKGHERCTGRVRTGEVWPPVQRDVLCGFLHWLVIVAHSVLIAAPCAGAGGL